MAINIYGSANRPTQIHAQTIQLYNHPQNHPIQAGLCTKSRICPIVCCMHCAQATSSDAQLVCVCLWCVFWVNSSAVAVCAAVRHDMSEGWTINKTNWLFGCLLSPLLLLCVRCYNQQPGWRRNYYLVYNSDIGSHEPPTHIIWSTRWHRTKTPSRDNATQRASNK